MKEKIKLGIIGYPLEHTLSPVMQEAALQSLNIDGEYLAYQTEEENLKERLDGLIEEGVRGVNITIPYKTKIINFVDDLDEDAKLIGAVNTLSFKKGRSRGSNTDIVGFWKGIPESYRNDLEGKEVCILGNGGAANAVGLAFLKANVSKIKIIGRNKEKLNQFRDFLASRREMLQVNSEVGIELLEGCKLHHCSVLVNTTPIGMYPNVDCSPLSEEQLSVMNKGVLIYDLIYNPKETELLKLAKKAGLKTQNGLDMLAGQGAAALAIWLEKDIYPVEVMRDSIDLGS